MLLRVMAVLLTAPAMLQQTVDGFHAALEIAARSSYVPDIANSV
jgi:hypothetical protein